ncbi:gliding motility-associated C-terminal domain-containing protein, partial [Bacteroidota bacterium]|nr:gliding motility-associated C-terminal domain-containing protein [Bacteroidota bacterium]
NGMADDAEGTVPLDSDGDGLANHLDLDSDNDGIYDVDEGGDGDQDTNNDGMVDANDVGFSDNDNDGMADGTETTRPPDTDNDGYMDYVDLDADNDGIYDVVEGGDGDQDTNGDGMIDDDDTGFTDTNNNGMADNAESTPAPDTDNNMVPDYMDLDSDGDGCADVIEAGFVDDDGDGYLGLSPTVEDSMGVVVSAPDGYTTPADNDGNGTPDFLEVGTEAMITQHPDDLYLYDEGDSIVMTAGVTPQTGVTYQWQYSVDDGNAWISISNDTINNTIFNGLNTSTLNIYNVGKQFDNNLFRLVASTPGYSCGDIAVSDNSRLILREIFIPNGFSPNGDGINDTWHITGIDRFPENHVEIYSRWEIKVFDTDNYNSNKEWDGTDQSGTISYGSGLVPEGTYFYIIDLGEGKASRKPIKGYVYVRKPNR